MSFQSFPLLLLEMSPEDRKWKPPHTGSSGFGFSQAQ